MTSTVPTLTYEFANAFVWDGSANHTITASHSYPTTITCSGTGVSRTAVAVVTPGITLEPWIRPPYGPPPTQIFSRRFFCSQVSYDSPITAIHATVKVTINAPQRTSATYTITT